MPPINNQRTLFAEMWNAIVDNLKEDHLINKMQQEKLKFTEVTELYENRNSDATSFLTSSSQEYDQDISGKIPSAAISVNGSSNHRFTPSIQNSYTSVRESVAMQMEENLGEYSDRLYLDPEYLTSLKNGATKIEFFPNDSEAERRFKFFAHTL
jgi:hypothetical protein